MAFSQPTTELLNEEERAWLAEHPVIRLGVGVAFPPYQWVEREGDVFEFKGMVSEYVKILENRLGVSMQVMYGLNFNEALTLGQQKKIDLFPCLAQTPERSEFLMFTRPFISYPSVIITREDAPFIGNMQDLQGRKVSLVKNQYFHSLIKRNYQDLRLTIVETKNAADDLQAVSFGKSDACLMDLGVASYFTQKLRLANLKIAAPTEIERVELTMGVRDDWPIFQGIVQKTLDSISREELDAITQRWINLKYEPGLAYAVIIQWTAIIGAFILVVMGLFLYWNRNLKLEIRARKKIEDERNELITELNKSLQEVKTLQGFLPICSHCRKVREDSGYWQKIETYIQEHTDTRFTHGICPDCMRELYPHIAEGIIQKHEGRENKA
nr:transporter substrate-binding domain-containing protein [uncultured Desulfobulbus sp.]